jgi:thiamine biosynthesis protein ThiI
VVSTIHRKGFIARFSLQRWFSMHYMLRVSSDVTTKAPRTRRRFTRAVCDNLRDAFASHDIAAAVHMGWVRLFVESADPRAPEVARRVFGVHSVSPVETHPFTDYAQLLDAGTRFFEPRMRGHAFAVRAHSRGTALRGNQIERDLGERLVPYGRVRLTNPDVTCSVEIREGQVHLYTDSMRGYRGLPIGTQGRGLVLFSGGFDSAIAAWMMLRRGVELDYVVCRLGGPVHTLGAVRVLQVLGRDWSYGSRARLFVVPFEAVADAIRANCRPSAVQLVLKRFMYRTAEALAPRLHAAAIVTGESLGQVSSQTLKNLVALDAAAEWPILRPLIGMDKDEILQRSREIGTYDVSAVVQEYCALSAGKPSVGATRREVQAEEAKVDIDVAALIDAPAWDARALREADFSIAGIEIDHVPDEAVVLDLRSKASFDHWHYPGAMRMDMELAGAHVEQLDRGRVYLSYCEFGLKSAHLAMQMHKAGLQAHSFQGGSAALLRYAVQRELAPREMLA